MESWWCSLSALLAFGLVLQLDALYVSPVGVKHGECPKYVRSPYFQSCADKCYNDYDCGYNEKCCYHGCGRTCVAITSTNPINPGVKHGECPKYVRNPYNQYVQSCPDKCYNDYDCGYNEKCCYQGCGRTCVAITSTNPINPRVKHGECPQYVRNPYDSYVQSCPDKCYNDYDCGYNEKCCYHGCGRTCVAIRSTYPTNRGVKHGECPKYVRNPFDSYVQSCDDKCYNDYDCGYNEKCCYQGCGRTCVAITPTYPTNPINRGVKHGECPQYVRNPYNQYVQSCPDKCYNDYDCGYNEKCCYQGCGRACVAVKRAFPCKPYPYCLYKRH